MWILGLNIGHNATAALLNNGKIVGCVSEERFSRMKNQYGIPTESINYVLKNSNITLSNIDLIVLDDQYPVINNRDFSKQFIEDYTKKSFLKRILSKIGYNYPNLFHNYLYLKDVSYSSRKTYNSKKIAFDLSRTLNFPEEKIIVIDHHLAHALSPCFNLPKKNKTLIFTLDGEGGGLCASVNIYDGNSLKTISQTKKEASIGYLYALATLFLGMKPLEHEFKVMGLAPYAKKNNINEIYSKFDKLIWINNNLEFESKFSMPFADYFFEREMKFARFDNVAGAVQKLVEERTSEWILRAIEKTGISDIALSGGVFMNVKANQKISEMPQVKSLFVMPSCGDESSAIGSLFYGYKIFCLKNNLQFSPRPFSHLYLGPEYSEDSLKELIKNKALKKKYNIKKISDVSGEIARLLAEGKIVARCSGKSEWGARALGNRSILADPSNPDAVRILNETIKDRDFWMPFTPSILDKFEKRYIINKKDIFAPYMAITFNSTNEAKKKISAAIHPYDFTVRPQIVTKDFNPEYYSIIERFSKLTGIGAVLNTSFNLHGEPNVLTPEDALHTVESSDLRYLFIGDYLFVKKKI